MKRLQYQVILKLIHCSKVEFNPLFINTLFMKRLIFHNAALNFITVDLIRQMNTEQWYYSTWKNLCYYSIVSITFLSCNGNKHVSYCGWKSSEMHYYTSYWSKQMTYLVFKVLSQNGLLVCEEVGCCPIFWNEFRMENVNLFLPFKYESSSF